MITHDVSVCVFLLSLPSHSNVLSVHHHLLPFLAFLTFDKNANAAVMCEQGPRSLHTLHSAETCPNIISEQFGRPSLNETVTFQYIALSALSQHKVLHGVGRGANVT